MRHPKSLSKITSAFIALCLAGSLVGCVLNESGTPTFDDDVNTTTIGAATGALFGAGLGVIVGSASGNAGEGLAIGALAGGVTGGLIGRELERQEVTSQERNESLERQDQMINQQRRELNELKEQNIDQVGSTRLDENQPAASNNRIYANNYDTRSAYSPSRAGGNEGSRAQFGRIGSPTTSGGREKIYLNPPSRPNQRAYPYSETESVYGSTESVSNARVQELANSGATTAKNSEVAKLDRVPSTYAKTTSEAALPQAKKEVAAADLDEADDELETTSLNPPEPRRAGGFLTEPPTQIARPAANAETASVAVTDASKCADGEEEAVRARNASSDADKLFYLTRALRLCPDKAQYHVEIGKVYAKIGRRQDAEYEFRQALEVDPNNSQAKEQLGLLDSTESGSNT